MVGSTQALDLNHSLGRALKCYLQMDEWCGYKTYIMMGPIELGNVTTVASLVTQRTCQ